jgi:hypothetical protein
MTLLEDSKEDDTVVDAQDAAAAAAVAAEGGGGLEGKEATNTPKLRYQCVADTARGEVRLIHTDDAVVVRNSSDRLQQTMGEGRCSGNGTTGELKPSRKPFVFVKAVRLNGLNCPPIAALN